MANLYAKVGSVVAAGAILFTSVLAVPVSAETVRQQAQDQVIANRCDRVTAKVDERIALYNQNKDNHIQRYTNIKTAVTNLVNKLKAEGYDVTAVVANLQTLDAKIKTAAENYTTFINTLESSKAFACGNSEGQFRSTIATALTQLKEFRTQTADIISYVKGTLRPSIQDLRNQHPAANQ